MQLTIGQRFRGGGLLACPLQKKTYVSPPLKTLILNTNCQLELYLKSGEGGFEAKVTSPTHFLR